MWRFVTPFNSTQKGGAPVAKLIATTPCAGLLPLTVGTLTLAEVEAGRMTLIAPLDGAQKATSEALKSALGVGFPAPNRTLGQRQDKGPRMVWCGMGQALLMGADCPDLPQAAVMDHSDAWAIVRVDGAHAAAVLARLTPVDLRDGVFKRGHTARTLLAHMTVSITRLGVTTFEVMAMRSMAGTLVHDLEQAAKNVAARAALT